VEVLEAMVLALKWGALVVRGRQLVVRVDVLCCTNVLKSGVAKVS